MASEALEEIEPEKSNLRFDPSWSSPSMAIISGFEEEEEKQPEAKPSASSSSASSSAAAKFSARFDPSSPLGFIEEAFEFVAEQSDFLAHEAAKRDVAAVLRAVREKQKQKLRQVEREKERKRERARKAKAVAAAAKKVEE